MGVTLKRNGDVVYYGKVVGKWKKNEPRKEAKKRGFIAREWVKVIYHFYLGNVVKPVSDITEYTLADLREHIEFKLNNK